MADSSDTIPTIKIADQWADEFEAAIAAYRQAEAALSTLQLAAMAATTDRQTLKHLGARDDALWGLVRARTPNKWMLIEKMQILLQLMTDNDWTDRRDLILAASVLRDIQDQNWEAANG